MLQDMRNGPQSYNVNHNNTVTEPSGTHLPTTNGRQQVQDFSGNQDGYENVGYGATQHYRLQDNGVSHLQGNNSQEGQVPHSDFNIPQNVWTEDSTLQSTMSGDKYEGNSHVLEMHFIQRKENPTSNHFYRLIRINQSAENKLPLVLRVDDEEVNDPNNSVEPLQHILKILQYQKSTLTWLRNTLT